jgi:hypothetical protein
MANEALNKFAYSFERQNPKCKVMAFNWGPWDEGMVGESLKRAMAGTDARLIPTETGCGYFLDAFAYRQERGSCQSVVNCCDRLIRPVIDIGAFVSGGARVLAGAGVAGLGGGAGA